MLKRGYVADFALWNIESIEELGYWTGFNPCAAVVRGGKIVRGHIPCHVPAPQRP